MTLFPNHPCWNTLRGRLLAFASWFLLIVCILTGAVYSIHIDSLFPGYLGATIGFFSYCGLQWLATQSKKHTKKCVSVDSKPSAPPFEQEQPKQEVPSVTPEHAEPDEQPEPSQEQNDNAVQPDARFFVDKCREYLRSLLPEQAAKSGGLPYTIGFEYPNTNNIARLGVERNYRVPGELHLTTQVGKKDSDLCMMNYMHRGTLDELLAYLADDGNVPALLDSLQHLSDGIDDRD